MTTQGKRLQQIRKTLNIKQEDLGQVLKVSRQVVSNIEADRVTLNNDKLVSLGENFNINLNYLLLGTGEMFNKPQKSSLSRDDIIDIVEKMLEEKLKEK